MPEPKRTQTRTQQLILFADDPGLKYKSAFAFSTLCRHESTAGLSLTLPLSWRQTARPAQVAQSTENQEAEIQRDSFGFLLQNLSENKSFGLPHNLIL